MIRPTQRTYGKGMGKGKKIGRIQGAAAGGFSVAALSGLSIAQLKKKAEQAETARQRAAVKAAIERAMRELAQKDKAKAELGKVKPKPRPQSKAKGGTVKKMNTGGVSTIKPKPRPNTNKSGNPSFRDRSSNEKALQFMKKLKTLEEKDFKKAQNFILNMIEKKKK